MAEIMTADELAELRNLDAAATPGPWRHEAFIVRTGEYHIWSNIYGVRIANVGMSHPNRVHADNAALIAAARNALPKLLATIETMRESALGQLRIVEIARQERETAERKRDNARAECRWLAGLLERERVVITDISEGLTDEGGRVYLNSTNDADDLRDLAQSFDDWAMDRIMRPSKYPDHIGVARAANKALAAAQADNERLRDALETAASIAETFAMSRTLPERHPTDIVRGRWEGEQAASAEIAARIRAALNGGESDD